MWLKDFWQRQGTQGVFRNHCKVLKLHYDVTATGPDDRALMDWQRKQFAKLGIQLVIRSTDYNRFQRKVRRKSATLFMGMECRLS